MKRPALATISPGLSTVALIVVASTLVWAVAWLDTDRQSTHGAVAAAGTVRSTAKGGLTLTSEVREIPLGQAMAAKGEADASPSEPFPAPDIVIEGQGTTPADPLELAAGLWIADIKYLAYEPPTLGTIPNVSVNSRFGVGGMAWSGRSWAALFVGDWQHPGHVATFTPGEVIVQVSAIPEDVQWIIRFRPLGELQRP